MKKENIKKAIVFSLKNGNIGLFDALEDYYYYQTSNGVNLKKEDIWNNAIKESQNWEEWKTYKTWAEMFQKGLEDEELIALKKEVMNNNEEYYEDCSSQSWWQTSRLTPSDLR